MKSCFCLMRRGVKALGTSLLFVCAAHSLGQIDIGTTSTADGANVTVGGSVTWNLANARTATWDANPTIPGQGVYDPTYWAVVYKFGNLTINAGATLTFANHPTHAPVLILVQGTFTCNGTIDLNGSGYQIGAVLTQPGPGGFSGGAGFTVSSLPGGGSGPGGGYPSTSPGTYPGGSGSHQSLGTDNSGPTYGTANCIPLLGGSGGAGVNVSTGTSGGAGGGAILIAARSSIVFGSGGIIRANGGNGNDHGSNNRSGSGSGGAIRLVTDHLVSQSTSMLSAAGGFSGLSGGGYGRVRIEHNSGLFSGLVSGPPASVAAPGAVAKIFPASTDPKCVIKQVGSVVIGDDPQGGFGIPDAVTTSLTPQTVRIECYNVPVDGTWTVTLKITPRYGANGLYVATVQPGSNFGFSVWNVTVPFGTSISTAIARAFRTS